jgi:hypothetical protein
VILDIEFDSGQDDVLRYFDGSSSELGIQSIRTNLDTRGRILELKSGGAVNQVRKNGKWKCIAFAGIVPDSIAQRIMGASDE